MTAAVALDELGAEPFRPDDGNAPNLEPDDTSPEAMRARPAEPEARVPSYDFPAEKAILEAALSEPDLAIDLAARVRSSDFFATNLSTIWRAVEELVAANRPVSVVSVTGLLRERGKLAQVGGAEIFAHIIDSIPATRSRRLLDDAVKQVRDRANVRRIADAATRIAADGHGATDPAAYLVAARSTLDGIAVDVEPVEAAPTWRPSADIARAIAGSDPPVRLPLGLATLDELTRGLPVGARAVLVGAPGAGKTALGVQWAHQWAIGGARVAYLAADQSPAAMLVRIGEREGLDRDDLDGVTSPEARRSAWAELARRLDALPGLVVLDGADVTIDDAARIVQALPGDGPRVLVVDSAQTARCAAAETATTPRERIDAALRAMRAAQAAGVLVVVVSEMARGGYRSGDSSQNTSALASAKESGSVEYAADLLLGLTSVKGEPDLVDVEVAKNRLGPKGELRLRLDRRHATLAETERPTDDDRNASRDARDEKRIADAEQRIVRAIVIARLRTKADVYAAVRGRRTDAVSALSRLLTTGRVERADGAFRVVSNVTEGDPNGGSDR